MQQGLNLGARSLKQRYKMVYVEQLILAILLSISLTTLGEDEMGLELLDSMECVCPGQSLTYECTVMGKLRGQSVWSGNVFDNYCTSREISLFHGDFDSTEGSFGECGEIVARSVRVNNKTDGNNSVGYFVSQVSFPVSSNTAGKNIECQYDDGNPYLPVGDMIIPTETGALAPPDRLHMSNADSVTRQVTFDWSSVAPDCPAIHYNILASNCGSCPTTTNHTNVTCTDVPTDGSECTFAVQTVVCGNITGNFSSRIGINVYPTDIITAVYPTDNTAYIAAISSLATFSVVSITAFLAVIVIILIRSKAKIKAALDQQATDTGVRSTQMESVYEDPIPSVSRINTQDNIAYGHTQKTTTQI